MDLLINTVMIVTALGVSPAVPTSDLDELGHLIGTWESADGMARQSFELEMDGAWITTRMWFKTAAAWKLVSQGGIYRHPRNNEIVLVSRTRDMEGIELFESVLVVEEPGMRLANTAYMPGGVTIVTEEEWSFPSRDEFLYTVFKVENGSRTQPWLRGRWLRQL